ncbi:MAG: Transposase for insertion sequence element [Rickettsiaceae bacterium]|jgi:transposase-like protein|nr:Transposase for insertion sequence element [Rickettsiaceae bacterium]
MSIDRKKLNEALDVMLSDEVNLTKLLQEGDLLKELRKALLERALSAELDEHLGYDKHSRSDSDDSRNGVSSKQLITEDGTFDIEVPRDRDSSFAPQIVKKRQKRIAGLEEKILYLYAKGMSVSDISIQLEEMYGTGVSESLISRVTNEVLDEVRAWQNRPLDSVYPIVYFDCLVVKVRHDKRIINKSVYAALGIDTEGKKDVLGLWISENEGAKFWLSNLTEMKNRGMQDMLIACSDNLSGMTEAIAAVYPKTDHQLCIVHQIRNSLKHVSYKDRKEVAKELKPIYQAATENEALAALESFEQKWSSKYPQIAKSWYNNWPNLVVFLDYPEAIRKIIYTTNMLESLNSQLRKVTNNKRVLPNDEAVFKSLFLTIQYIVKKWTMPIQNWNEAMAHFMIKFEGRI